MDDVKYECTDSGLKVDPVELIKCEDIKIISGVEATSKDQQDPCLIVIKPEIDYCTSDVIGYTECCNDEMGANNPSTIYRTQSRLLAAPENVRTHPGELPYVCPLLSCNERYDRSDHLQRHIRTTTHGERPSSQQQELREQAPGNLESQLAEKDLERRKRRRESNRQAAEKSRVKKRFQNDSIHKELADMKLENGQLRDEVELLRKELKSMTSTLYEHIQNCPKPGSLVTLLNHEDQ